MLCHVAEDVVGGVLLDDSSTSDFGVGIAKVEFDQDPVRGLGQLVMHSNTVY